MNGALQEEGKSSSKDDSAKPKQFRLDNTSDNASFGSIHRFAFVLLSSDLRSEKKE